MRREKSCRSRLTEKPFFLSAKVVFGPIWEKRTFQTSFASFFARDLVVLGTGYETEYEGAELDLIVSGGVLFGHEGDARVVKGQSPRA